MKKLIVIDNFDSFTYNLVQMFKNFELDIHIFRNNKVSLEEISLLDPDYILISPGPRTPAFTGISKPLIRHFHKKVPILGVCLGMQCINEIFYGTTIEAPVPVHGKTSEIFHTHKGLFTDIPSPFRAARYHSLIIDRRSDELIETAHTRDGIIMGIQHRKFPLYGVQFHPESFMTENGEKIIKQFLNCRKHV